MSVQIAGAGIAGLVMGLTLHQLKAPFRIFERVSELRPLGVGINLQPNAVRELIDLGLEPEQDRIGVRTRQYGFYSKSGRGLHRHRRVRGGVRDIGFRSCPVAAGRAARDGRPCHCRGRHSFGDPPPDGAR
jgi:2-polyprenyl-6-methoxyphenol hydroxylase-like FAD-dependent oxidoreductase